MKRVIAGPMAVFVLMVVGCLMSATAHAQATWPMGVQALYYGDLPAPGPDWDSDLPVLTGLSPVITPPSAGGQCYVTCTVSTWGDPFQRLNVELRPHLFDATGTRILEPEWPPIAFIDSEGRAGSATAPWVFSLRGGQSYRFGCTIQAWWQSSDVVGLGGSVSWVCAGARASRSVLNSAANGSR